MFKIYLFSPVKGVVLDKGVPVEGALIERSWKWKEVKGGDAVKTNQDGTFSFPAASCTNISAHILPYEIVIRQDIKITYREKSFETWLAIKRESELNAELNGKTIDLLCELQSEPKRHGDDLRGAYFGIAEAR